MYCQVDCRILFLTQENVSLVKCVHGDSKYCGALKNVCAFTFQKFWMSFMVAVKPSHNKKKCVILSTTA